MPENNIATKLETNEMMRIGSEIATAIAYLHSLSPPMLHCDLKPSNVMLTNHLRVHIANVVTVIDRTEIEIVVELGSIG